MKDKMIQLANHMVLTQQGILRFTPERYAVLAWAWFRTNTRFAFKLTNGAQRFFWTHKLDGATHSIDIVFGEDGIRYSSKVTKAAPMSLDGYDLSLDTEVAS